MYITLEKLSAMRLFKTLLFPLFYVGAFVSGLRCSVLSPNPPPTHTHTPTLRFHFHFHSHFRFRSLSSNTCVNKCITQSALALFSQFFSRPQCSNAPVFQCLGRGSFSSWRSPGQLFDVCLYWGLEPPPLRWAKLSTAGAGCSQSGRAASESQP